MKLQILKLIIWPKADQFAPRIVEFQPGKLNVITGASRTGKSALIPIIDYCLASSDCFIPIDTIRDYASWYGIVFETNNEQFLIGRRVPNGNKVSNDFYYSRGSIVSIPPSIPEANETSDGVKNILNGLSSVPYFSLENEENKKAYTARLGFRDLVALNFQNQDIVANQNILFYKTHAHEHRERLRNWFPFILGVENLEILSARQRIQELEKQLTQLKREFDKAKAISASWMANMMGHLRIAKEYGLFEGEIDDKTLPIDLLTIAKEIVANVPEHSKTNLQTIQNANSEIEKLELEEQKISEEIGVTKKRLTDLRNLKGGLIEYGHSVKKRAERLHVSKWLKDVAQDTLSCPICGSSEHPNSNFELNKIALAFEKYEDEANRTIEVPTSFDREEVKIQNELKALFERKDSYQKRYDLLISKDKKAQEEFQQRKNMFLFIGHLKSSTETFESLIDGGEYQAKIELLQKEYDELAKIVDYKELANKIDIATAKISQGILKHLKTLDVEDKYRAIAPKFDIKDLNISVLSDDNHWHFLAEVGSASNWVSFHLALMCALQEYFIETENSSVPSFVIFDQPSQVYFPKLRRQINSENYDPAYEDEDVEAVRNMFRTIISSIKSTDGAWQGIILDHADDAIYSSIEDVHEVEVWRNGKKLIPIEWYENL